MNTTMIINQLLLQKGGGVITTTPTTTVLKAVQLMDEKRVGFLIVLDKKEEIAGVFSERDIRKIVIAGKDPATTQVRSAMTKMVYQASPDDTVDTCMNLMTEKRIRHLPVLDAKQRLVGIISIGDLVKFVASEQHNRIRNLEKYIEGSL